MSHYKTNLRDIEFNLFEVLGRDEILGSGPFAELDGETAREILREVERLSREDLAASYEDADRNPPVFDPETHTAPIPASFKKSYDAWMDSEWWRLQIVEDLGGQQAPSSIVWALGEFVLGANAPVWMYAAGPAFAGVVHRNGTERDKRIAQLMVEKKWGATMVLTEPDAGSDVGAGRSKATPNEDGSWNITGVKRFITSAESDLQDNIIHLVLARPAGVEGVGGPGTKGLSLFVVPKYHFDHESGELTGERNGVYVTNVEHKMGIKVSNTCEVTFGDPQVGGGEPAQGWLLGEVHDGIAQMFQVIENARMMVGTKAIATLSTGYLNALEYAKSRVQGADLTNSAKTAPRVTITHHPDVRRSLMTQKASAEAMRSLVLYTASWQDKVQIAEAAGERDELAEAVNDLLLPIVKGYGSERSWVLLGTESLQTFGGSGFLQEYPIEQYVRDAKIDTLYEGTTAIQGQDFFFRKIVKDQGRALGHLAGEIKGFIESEAGNGRLKNERELLATALDDANALVGLMINDLMSADASSGGDIRNVYKVALNTSRLLMALGDVVCGWLLLRGAEVAIAKLDGDPGKDKAFYEGKVAAAQFFAQQNLPRISAERKIAESTDLAIMDLDEAAF
ncbi:alkylation response protein AidB-like acyl-CoA dehydrogenase [Nocardioides zeae]|uniref:Alkylation response protein AidB-like acyl-CoA dehydrogenase n=2 Tax=Nocardioides zeae TaxID=1457234 RepID=A0ACC6IJ09_9ACTN|nr:acyl-CoA dehydrogenase [Nocardioides zeae]MDQ1105760.1 alkylation response protein AidB-like acyl-CoA dehydrogenase [Nocardioides zeae]MDR6174593.1 alkylation response protein AidB-like acyl-CoA dehydrogenase [Nocardioides zeae]MDR6210664.1 alkylation response protein AidB-like acyl-CoA dehydrogenase [Nocardioides zeae]